MIHWKIKEPTFKVQFGILFIQFEYPFNKFCDTWYFVFMWNVPISWCKCIELVLDLTGNCLIPHNNKQLQFTWARLFKTNDVVS